MAGVSDKATYEAWDFYRRVAWVRRTADLHAAGFASGALQVATGGSVLTVQGDPALFREVGLGLYVAGVSPVCVHVGDTITLERAPDEGADGLLIAVNEQECLRQLLGAGMPQTTQEYGTLVRGSLLQRPVLSTGSAKELSSDMVADLLLAYRKKVALLKQVFAAGLRRHLEETLSGVSTYWVPDWGVEFADLGPAYQMGYVYQVFRAEGIDLLNLKNGVIDSLEQRVRAGTVVDNVARRVVSSFG